MNTVPMKPSPSDSTPPREASCACPPSNNGGNKTKRNFFVDLATAVVFGSMMGTGILLKWVLPPGRFGGRGLTWLGLDRHTWGDVHLWLAFGLLTLIVTHVVLHWSWVSACWRRCVGTWRSARTWAVLGVLAILLLLPLVVPSAREAGQGFGRARSQGLHATADRTERDQVRGGRGWGRGMRERRLRRIAEAEDDAVNLGTELWEGDFGP